MSSLYEEYLGKDILNEEEEDRVSRANVDKWILRLFLLLIGFTPIIVLGSIKEVISPLISNESLLTSGIKGDLYSNFKSLFVIIITIVTGLLLLAKIFFMNGRIKETKLNYFLVLFSVAIVLSTVLSPNISIALNGQFNRSDGAITWLCYIALLFIAINIEYPKKVVQYVMYSLIPFVVINLVIITMYFYEKDLLQLDFVQSIISVFLPREASLSEGSFLIGTLNHGNYMSGMFAILTMMYLAGVIIEKNIALKVLNLILSMFTIIVVLMALSTSGFLTILCISPFILWLIIKSDKKIISIAMFAILLIFSGISFHTLAQKNSKVWDETFGFFTSSNPYDDEVTTSFVGNNYNLGQFVFGHNVSAADSTFELPVVPETGVGAGSGRIYIWEKTLDLVMDRPLFGYGLDTLMYNFPHYNIDARANLESEAVIVDKPHNMYIGVLYGTGIVGFLGLMGIVIVTLVISLKTIIRLNSISSEKVILSVAWIAFLVQAIFNDTLVGVTVPLIIMAGVMIVLNNPKGEIT